uniref:Uncharacterized protein n=1 Tax=Aegilops tauschii subsp. strangulata TaxID=200361 RepID=A0A453HUL5_AEGTS
MNVRLIRYIGNATGAQTKSPCPPLSSAQLSPTTRVPPVVTTDSLYCKSVHHFRNCRERYLTSNMRL